MVNRNANRKHKKLRNCIRTKCWHVSEVIRKFLVNSTVSFLTWEREELTKKKFKYVCSFNVMSVYDTSALMCLLCEVIILILPVISRSVVTKVSRVPSNVIVRILLLPDCWYTIPMAKFYACDVLLLFTRSTALRQMFDFGIISECVVTDIFAPKPDLI